MAKVSRGGVLAGLDPQPAVVDLRLAPGPYRPRRARTPRRCRDRGSASRRPRRCEPGDRPRPGTRSCRDSSPAPAALRCPACGSRPTACPSRRRRKPWARGSARPLPCRRCAASSGKARRARRDTGPPIRDCRRDRRSRCPCPCRRALSASSTALAVPPRAAQLAVGQKRLAGGLRNNGETSAGRVDADRVEVVLDFEPPRRREREPRSIAAEPPGCGLCLSACASISY